MYNYLIQQKWNDAASLLSKSEQLEHSRYQFLYDILSVNASESLLKTVTYDQYQENTTWWQKFLTYELCINKDKSFRADIVQRISITVSCLNEIEGIDVPTIQSGPDTEQLVRIFWDMVLNSPNLTNKRLDNFLASQPSQLHNSYFALNSHTILDKFAEMDRLKVIRNAFLFQRVENNYQAWRRYIGAASSDSFYIYTPIHQWLNPDNTSYRSDLNLQLPRLLPQLSINVQRFLAKELLDHIESGLVDKSSIHLYHTLLPLMPIEDHFVLQTFSELSNWAEIEPLPNYTQLSEGSKRRHSEVALHLVFNTRSAQLAKDSGTFDGYMFGMETLMREFSMQYSMFNISKEIEHSFNDQGSLTNSSIRRLVRLWKRTWPNTDVTSEAYQLP
jgi:hypothetical protein